MAEGHANARHYPVVVAWSEAAIVRDRLSDRMTTDAVVLHAAICAIWSKEGSEYFQDVLKGLKNGG